MVLVMVVYYMYLSTVQRKLCQSLDYQHFCLHLLSLIQIWITRIAFSAGKPKPPSPCPLPPAPPGGCWSISRQDEKYNHSRVFLVCLWVSCQQDVPETLFQGVSGTWHCSSWCGEAAVLLWVLLDVWAAHPISTAKPSHPVEQSHFCRLYLHSHSFGHYP